MTTNSETGAVNAPVKRKKRKARVLLPKERLKKRKKDMILHKFIKCFV